MTKIVKQVGAWLVMLGMLCWLTAGMLYAAAAEEIIGSLTMYCKTAEDVILTNMHWDLYQVGGRNADGELELQGDFADYAVSLEDTSATALARAAETLENYAILDGIEPFAFANSDANGYLKFSNLGEGLYLVAGDPVQIDNAYYFPAAFFIEISEQSLDKDYDLTAYPKYVYRDFTEGSEYSVKKVWLNDEHEPGMRPTELIVDVYRDEVLFETVTLSEANDWTYTWTADRYYEWRVMERVVPDHYFVVYRTNGVQYVIENALTTDSSYTEPASSTDSQFTDVMQTTATDSEMTETMDTTQQQQTETIATTAAGTQPATTAPPTTTTATTTTTPPEKLPQTGQLWWPVPLLAVAGLVSVGVGLRLRTKEE